jgi:hypothetical protein
MRSFSWLDLPSLRVPTKRKVSGCDTGTMCIFAKSITAEDLALYISCTYMILDLVLTKFEKLLDHVFGIKKKLHRFKQQAKRWKQGTARSRKPGKTHRISIKQPR